MAIDKRKAGLFPKFNVTRTDGTDAPGGKHHGCDYFVLDVTHDPFAAPALLAYAKACEKEYPALAKDLLAKCRTPRHGALRYFNEKRIASPMYVPRAKFDEHAKLGLFSDGPFRDSFGDGYGEPYNPRRQAFGINATGGEGLYTELSED